jgi:phage protein D
MAQGTLDLTLTLDGAKVGIDEIHECIVEADLDQPDMCAIQMSNQSTTWADNAKEGDTIEIKLGLTSAKTGTVFKGELVGIEPIYSGGPARVILRGLNALHRLARGKKSVAYLNVTDADMVDKICSAASLTANYGDSKPTVKYDHVYQHNQTDLEFLRLRAARIGFELFCQDTTLYFRKRTTKESNIKLTLGATDAGTHLERFSPRLSTANQVSEVRVRAWDPDQKKEIIGSAKPSSSKLGDKVGADIVNKTHSNVLFIDVDVPIFSKEQADKVAASLLEERQMAFITGDAVAAGNPDIKPGVIVEVSVGSKRFDGKYYVVAVRHRYMHSGPEHGLRTLFKFKRDAHAG